MKTLVPKLVHSKNDEALVAYQDMKMFYARASVLLGVKWGNVDATTISCQLQQFHYHTTVDQTS